MMYGYSISRNKVTKLQVDYTVHNSQFIKDRNENGIWDVGYGIWNMKAWCRAYSYETLGRMDVEGCRSPSTTK